MAEKTKKSKASNVLFAVVIVVFLAVVVGLISIDGILKSAIQTAIKKQLNVDASVSKVNLNIISGTVRISDLKIGNPPGYQFERILETKSIMVKTSLGSLLSDPIEIEQIKIDGIAVVLEQKGLSSNLNDILKSMPEKPKTEPAKAKKDGKGVHITSVDINDISVTAKLLPIPGKSDAVTLKIASLHLSNIGGEKSSLSDNVKKIFTEIANAIATEGTNILPSDMVGPIQENVAKSLESVGEMTKEAEKGVKDATKALKGLFQKKE
ncbi:MAG: AsmA family protein [Phycisphaerae bacterium]|nr:AsmA family protein [Phycisphaerae bacterium]